MSARIVDLKVLYGIAGAREQFENLCAQLIKSVHPNIDKVRVSRGDGGIDAYQGNLSNGSDVEVFQCKFFAHGLDETQKSQIRDSFSTCRKSVRLKRWTLCLSIDMSREEKKWFDSFRDNQAEYGVEITDPWAATQLEHLLYQAQNKGILEAFFKQEHLTQIREVHEMMPKLVPDLVARLQEGPAAEARNAEAQARSVAYISQSVDIQKDHYLKINLPPKLRLSELQEAKRRGDAQYSARLLESARTPDYWQIAISPARIPDQAKLSNLSECWSVVEAAQEKRIGRMYPTIRHDQRKQGSDWTGSWDIYGAESECWSMSERGLFTHHFTLYDDVKPIHLTERATREKPPGSEHARLLDIDLLVKVLTDVYQFAARLADRLVDSADEPIRISVRLTGTQNRVLTARDDPGRMMGWYVCTLDALERALTHKCGELQASPDALAVKALVWYVERFGMPDVREETLASVQRHVLSKR